MQQLLRREIGDMVAFVAHSTRADGDLSPSTVPADELEARRSAAVPYRWRALHQVHSDRVIVANGSVDPSHPRERADALVTTQAELALAVHSGDCVPVGFVSDGGAVGAAHAGWKGLEAGVLEAAVRTLRSETASAPVVAVVGPHIRVGHYEFGANDLARLSGRFGSHIVGQTIQGSPALDLTAAIASELQALDVHVVTWSPDCTAANAEQYWSHRARSEPGRIALVAWLEHANSAPGGS